MKSALKTSGLLLFSAVALFLVWFGVTYISAETMLWFHAAAVPEAARGDVLPLYRALMNLIGGSSASLGVLGLYVVWGPLRAGSRWAGALLFTTFTGALAVAAVTAEDLAAATGAPTSWHIMGVLMAVAAAAFAASLFGYSLPRKTVTSPASSPRSAA